MASFSFNVDPRFNSDEAKRKVENFVGTVEELIDLVEEFEDKTGKSTNKFTVEIETTVKGTAKVKELERSVDNLTKAQKDRRRELQKSTSVEEGSVTNLGKRLSREKQLRNALNSTSREYAERSNKVKQLEGDLRRAKGIQDGSIAAIKEEGRALLEQLNTLNLNAQARERLQNAINRNAEAARRAAGIQQGSIEDLRAQQSQQQRLAESLEAGTVEQVNAARAAQQLGVRINSLTPKTLTFIGALNKLATIQAGFTAITAIFGQISGSIDKVVRRLKEVEAFNLALRNIGLSASETATAFGQAAATANRLGAPIQQVEKAYKRITPALKDIGASAQETDDFIANLTARTQVLGLTTEESGRLQEAFAQVLAKGKLQAEELTQQISEVDGAFRTQFAQALGITTAELQEFASQGVITASVFVRGVNQMQNGTEELAQKVANGTATVQQLQNIIGNLNLKTLEEIGTSIEPGIRAFLDAGRIIAQFFNDIASSPVGKLLGEIFNQVGLAVRDFVAALTGVLNVFVAIVSPLAQILSLFGPLVRVLVFLAISFKTASVAAAAYSKVTALAAVGNGKVRTSANFAAGALVKLATAMKAIMALKFKKALTDFAGSLADFGRLAGFQDVIKGLGRLRGGIKGFGGSVTGITNAAKAAGPAVGQLSLDLASVGYAEAGAGAAAKVASSGILASGASMAAAAAVAGALVVVVAAVVGGFHAFGEAGRLAGSSMNQLDADLARLGITTSSTKTLWGQFLNGLRQAPVIKQTVDLIDAIGAALSNLGFANQSREFRKTVGAVNDEFRKAGLGGITDFTNAQKLSREEADKLLGSLGALEKAQDSYAASIQEEINKEEAKGEGKNQATIDRLTEQKNKAENAAAGFRIYRRQLAAATAAAKSNADQNKNTEETLEGLEESTKKYAMQVEAAQQKVNTGLQDQYNEGLITEAELNLRTAATAAAAAKEKQKRVEETYNKFVNFQAKELKDADKAQQLTEKYEKEKADAAKEATQADAELKKAQLARIKEVIEANEELVGIYNDSAQAASGAFDSLSGSVTGAIDELQSAIQQQAAIEFSLTGDETVLNKALDTQREVLAFEYQIGRTKNQIAQEQRQFELELQAIKIQTLKLEAQQRGGPGAERLVSAYNRQLSTIQRIASLNQVTARAENLQLDYKIRREQQALNFAREAAGLPPFQIIDERNLDQTFADWNQFTSDASSALSQFGPLISGSFNQGLATARTGFQELQEEPNKIAEQTQRVQQEIKRGVDALVQSAKQLAEGNFGLELGEELSKALGGAFDEFSKGLESAPAVVDQIKSSTDGVKNSFDSSTAAAGSLNTELKTTNTLMEEARRLSGSLPMGGSMGVRALATGGPVTAGTSYFVNDGGGREAFVDMAGRAQLLPASRNIKWRAPRDGFVLPAPMTETLVQNSKINAKIDSVNATSRPRMNTSDSSVGISSSGNLIKQMGAMMGGNNTQRITNHVTIQSQSPVMDASKIMANVTKLRARRGIRQ